MHFLIRRAHKKIRPEHIRGGLFDLISNVRL
ncbi:hypothetical protein RD1_2474 [Roseobacter denitrificans OCh 114]|uniref:Uncharacterized protein n=1 Tax=Roseobacter denitrificans (strain ATCC 33942 / OCh 114) TaxID=375451 RepID=Q166Q4_ROSDO|nr:hypothetical protein RD1_2474 [Roseobacter denitrificans OCh 114]